MALRVLTRAEGTLPLLAKGVHRLKSGHLGVLDTWARVDLDYGGPDGAEMQTLYRATLQCRHSGISRDPDHLVAAALIAEIAEWAAPQGPDAAPAFYYLVSCLEELESGVNAPLFLGKALLQGLDLLGLSPVLEHPEFPAPQKDQKVFFNPAMGGVLPPQVRPGPEHTRVLRPQVHRFLLELRKHPETASTADANVLRESLTILQEFLTYHLEHPPRAWRSWLARSRKRSGTLASL